MSLFVRSLQKRGKKVRGRRALRDRAKNHISGNVPLEITLYLSSYIASMQQRGVDGSSCGQMSGALSQMVDALTGLERILQTPIPFSYAVHLWTVTLVWLVALPFQILDALGWLTIPGVALAAFVYCGLMKCAEGPYSKRPNGT
jgi:putative membrane protein